MHVFLTGDIRVGKSTIIRRWLEANSGLRLGGFRTVWKKAKGAEDNSFHIVPAGRDVPLTEENRTGLRRGVFPNREAVDFPEVFDTVGVALLESSRDCDLILMDEIGVSEEQAELFQQAVLSFLDSEIPVLGVVKDKPGKLTDAVRRHPNTEIITVTPENRVEAFEKLIGLLERRKDNENSEG